MAKTYHDIHMDFADGSVIHVPLTRANWNKFASDRSITTMYTHNPSDCHNPLERHLKAHGWIGQIRNPRVDEKPPDTEGEKIGNPRVDENREPVIWPPEDELTASQLQELSDMAMLDAIEILATPIKELPIKLVVDRRGQGLLF